MSYLVVWEQLFRPNIWNVMVSRTAAKETQVLGMGLGDSYSSRTKVASIERNKTLESFWTLQYMLQHQDIDLKLFYIFDDHD